ncbi:MAG: glycosyltransferase family 4 protein [Lachnospiraceae bacterium]|nr:glycosyltransferase family 4 protein [Lachnospiraceae bacterium]
MKNALIITPDMDLNGAQTVLSEMLEILSAEYKISIISPATGDYESIYTGRGYDIEIRPSVVGDAAFRRRVQNDYDLIWLNSSSVVPYVYFFINTSANVIWWLHETGQQLRVENNMLNPWLLSENIRIFGVSEAVRTGINDLFGYSIGILPIPVAEVSSEYAKPGTDIPDDKTVFFIPAAYSHIKGQDILLNSIISLPREMQEKSEFIFCGYSLPGQEDYYNSIRGIIEKLPNARDLGRLSRDEVYGWYERSDCVIAPSRVDSNPASIIEGMMFKKHVIASADTGVSHYMSDCENGFVFKNEDELIKRIMLVISDRASLTAICEAGYQLYKSRFSHEAIRQDLKEIGLI